MIYKKDSNFPYPVLSNTSGSYEESTFNLDIDLQVDIKNYIFEIEYNIDSKFMNDLLENDKAQLIFVIQSKDNKFYNIDMDQKYVKISKSRLSLKKGRTTIQLLIKANEDISFENNSELSNFYSSFKNKITVPKHSILGFSECVNFDGSIEKPLELFEKKINPNLKSDIKIELGHETIIIHYKNDDLQFSDSPMSPTLNNHYVYMGLQKSIYKFIVNNSLDEEKEEVDLDEIEEPIDALDLKLYNILIKKGVSKVSVYNMDEVIYLISDKILEKHTQAIKGLYKNAN